MCAPLSLCAVGVGVCLPVSAFSRSGLSAFLGSSSSWPAPALLELKLGALAEEGGTLPDLVQPQTLPEASLQLPSLPFLPPSLSLPPSPPQAGVPGGGTCQSLAVPLRLPAQDAATPREPGVWVPGATAGPQEAVGLRTLQPPLRPHGEYIWKGLGGAPPRWGLEKPGLEIKAGTGLQGNEDGPQREEGAGEGAGGQGGSAELDPGCSKHPVPWLCVDTPDFFWGGVDWQRRWRPP